MTSSREEMFLIMRDKIKRLAGLLVLGLPPMKVPRMEPAP
jgi:hypothetical protein